MPWFVAVEGQQHGPFEEGQLAASIAAGRYGPDAFVFGEGMADWVPLASLPQLARHLPAARAPQPARTPAAAAPARAAAPAAGDVPSHSLQEFLRETAERDRPGDVFELESKSMLEVHVNGRIWSKLGAMVAYRGNLKFIREGAFEGGLSRFLKKMVSGEAAPLAKIEGQGLAYLADEKKKISILRLAAGDVLNVNGNDLLAFEDTVTYDITMHRRVAGMLAGGLFSVRLTGSGLVAIMTHGEPLTLRVTPDDPLTTDPNATVAWSGSLSPQIKTDISFRTLIGRGGGEAFQMHFAGDGFVVVQPYEEKPVVAHTAR